MKSGVIQPHPSGDPDKSVIYTLDAMSASMPEWGLSMLMRSMVKSSMTKRISSFKASSYYANAVR